MILETEKKLCIFASEMASENIFLVLLIFIFWKTKNYFVYLH